MDFFTSKGALLGAGGFEAMWGLYMLCCTGGALTAAIGRHLRVGMSPSVPAVLSYAGGLRIAVGATIIVAATTPGSSIELIRRLIVVAVAHTCVLQPFAAACRSTARLPTGLWMSASLLEGGVLVAALGSDVDFDPDVLVAMPAFEAAAACFLIGIFLSLWALGAACCSAKVSDDNSQASSLSAPLFDPEKHKLSPASKRLLT